MKSSVLLLIILGLMVTGCGGGFKAQELSSTQLSSRAADDLMQVLNPNLHATSLKYFPSEQTERAPKRLFRLTRKQLDLTTQALLPTYYTAALAATMPRDPLQTNYEYSDILGFNSASFSPYVTWVEKIAASVRANPTSVIHCASSNNSASCIESQARQFIILGLRGTASEVKINEYLNFFKASVSAVGVAQATADLVDVVLSSPLYVYREEIQTDGSGLLAPAQRLQNITYTLADAPPNRVKLLAANPNQYLQTGKSLEATIDQVLATPEARDKLLRFFAAWLEIKEADEFTISPTEFPTFTPAVAAAAVDETKKFLNFHLAKAAPKLKDLTQSTQSFVSQAMASIYDMSPTNLSGSVPVNLDASKRLGLFTQPAVIASHSGPSSTRLVKRGVFFTRKVMCLEIGGVPSDANTTLPEDQGLTERQKIEAATNQGRCLGCHTFINPFGFIQENYDPIGRWRTMDAGQPINSQITVGFLDEGQLNTDSPVVAMKAFTESARFKQCFVRQLFRFYMGRQEGPSDDPLLRQMFFYFAENDNQDILGLLRIMGSSERFSQR